MGTLAPSITFTVVKGNSVFNRIKELSTKKNENHIQVRVARIDVRDLRLTLTPINDSLTDYSFEVKVARIPELLFVGDTMMIDRIGRHFVSFRMG